MTKYNDPGTEYCRSVVSGKILACKKIKQAAQRHLNDLERIGQSDFPFTYEPDLANGALNFCRCIPDVDTKQLLELMPFQQWIIAMIFGWRRIDGGKRWKKAFISMARTNSKTQIASWLCSFDFFFGTPKFNRQIICGANSNDQADRLLEYNKSTIESLLGHKPFNQWSQEVDINYDRIKWDKYHTVMKRISADTKGIDSMHATLAILDETHQCKDDTFVSKVSSGMVGNSEALLLQTSTAGLDSKVPLHREYEMLADVLAGKNTMDDYFIAIYEQDTEAEMMQPETWEKSNPLMSYAPKKAALMKGLISERDSMIAKGEQYKFLVKNMNIWQNHKQNRYLSIKEWKSGVIPAYNMKDQVCYMGYDQSMTSDETSVAAVFPYKENGQELYFVYQHSFIPFRAEGSIEDKERLDSTPYRQYEDEGWCDVTRNQAGIISIDQVYNWILQFIDDNNLKVLAFVYDSWHADNLIKALQNNRPDIKLVPLRQGTISLNAPTKTFRDYVSINTIKHLDDPLLETAMTNAVTVSDNNGIKVDKDTNTDKIDSVDAVIDAFSQAMYHSQTFNSLSELDRMTAQQLNAFFKSDRFSF